MEVDSDTLFGLELVLLIIGVIAAFMLPSFVRVHYLWKKALREIVAHNELGDDLKDEARVMLENDSYVLSIDWMRNNENQFSGELLVIVKKAVRLGKVCEARLWIFIFVFLALMGAVGICYSGGVHQCGVGYG